LIEYDTRVCKDRRMQPTPALSRFTFYGRRRTFRRKDDQVRGVYVDQYHSALLILLILPIGLTVLDALFTMMILEDGGWELILWSALLSNSLGMDFGSRNLLLSPSP
jgi:hypothetical protein